ncbi:Pleckstrin homology domain-containing protein, partial [Mycena maculata]
KPIERVYEYPLILESILQASSPTSDPHSEDLQTGLAASKRVVDRVAAAMRRAKHTGIVKSLQTHVGDWKGHHLETYGDLLLKDLLVVSRSNTQRDYRVFLFEQAMVLCKEITESPQATHSGNTPLLLKGLIFMWDVSRVDSIPVITNDTFPLDVWCSVQNVQAAEVFNLHFRAQDQRQEWEAQITRLLGGTEV